MSNKPVQSLNLIETFSEFKELKNIDKATMISVLEDSFRSVIAKMFGTDESFTVVINPDKGDCEIWRDFFRITDFHHLSSQKLSFEIRDFVFVDDLSVVDDDHAATERFEIARVVGGEQNADFLLL